MGKGDKDTGGRVEDVDRYLKDISRLIKQYRCAAGGGGGLFNAPVCARLAAGCGSAVGYGVSG